MKKNVTILFVAIGLIISCFVMAIKQGKEDFADSTGLSLNIDNVAATAKKKIDPQYDKKVKRAAAKFATLLLKAEEGAIKYKEFADAESLPEPIDLHSNGYVSEDAFYIAMQSVRTQGFKGYFVKANISNKKAFNALSMDTCLKLNDLTKKYNGPKCLGINPADASYEQATNWHEANLTLQGISEDSNVYLFIALKDT